MDLLFLLNLIVNYLLLAASGILRKRRQRPGRLLIAATVGALYSVFVFFPRMSVLAQGALRLLTGAGLVAVAFPPKTAREFVRDTAAFYGMLAAYGGGMYLFYAFTSAGAEMVYSNGVYYVDLPLWALLALSFGFYGLIRLIAFLQNRRAPQGCLTDVEIRCLGKYRSLKGMTDTGNALQDPLTLAPVVIAETRALKGLLPDDLLRAAAGGAGVLEEIAGRYRQLRCRLIPFRGVDGQSRMILAVRPDWIRRLPDGQPVENVVLGLTSVPLSPDGSYEILLHNGLWE